MDFVGKGYDSNVMAFSKFVVIIVGNEIIVPQAEKYQHIVSYKIYSFPKSYVSYRKPRAVSDEQRERARQMMIKRNKK